MQGGSENSRVSSALQSAGSVLGLAGYVYVLGGVIMWVRLTAGHLPADLTLSLLDLRVLFAVGLRALLFATVVLAVVGVAAYWFGRPHYKKKCEDWQGAAALGKATEDERQVRTIAGLNALVIALVIGLGVASFLGDTLPRGWIPVAILVLLALGAFTARYVAAKVFFGKGRFIAAAVLAVVALFCEVPIAVLLLASVAITAFSPNIARMPVPKSLSTFFHSPLPWALGGVYALVGMAFVAIPPVTYPRAVVSSANAQHVGGYIAHTSDGIYLATCTPQSNGFSTDERIELLPNADAKDVTLGGTPYRLDSGDRPALLTVLARTFGLDPSVPHIQVELRAAQPPCDASERATGGADLGLGTGVITGPAPPGGRAVGNERPIPKSSTQPLARLARLYQPTVEATVADRTWPVSVSSVLDERGKDRKDKVCLVVGGACRKAPPTLADLTRAGSSNDYLDYPAKLSGNPTNQFLAFTRGQGIDDDDSTAWLAKPEVLVPWQTAQLYFYYAGSADGVERYGDIPDGLFALQYWFFYPYNYYPTKVKRGLMQTSPLAGKPVNTDLHEGDWEHVSVLVDAAAPHRARFLYFARHDTEGKSVPWNSPSLSFDGTHPIVQGAFGGHPSYDNRCLERRRAKLHEQSSDWVVCGTGRYGFRADTTPLVDLARTGWACWPGHFGEATAKQVANAKLPELNPRRWDSKALHVAGPRSPLRQAENDKVCRGDPLAAEKARPIRPTDR